MGDSVRYFHEPPVEYMQLFRLHTLSFQLHSHIKVEFVYLLKGKHTVEYINHEGTPIREEMEPGQLCLFFPEVVHAYHGVNMAACGDSNEVLVGSFNVGINQHFSEKFSDMFFNHMLLNHVIEKEKLSRNVRYVLDCFSDSDIVKVKKDILSDYLFLMFDSLTDVFQLRPKKGGKDISYSDGNAIMRYLAGHIYEDSLCVEAVAKATGLSPSKISRYFSTSLNMSFRRYVNMARMENAKELLCNTNHSVKYIMMECGYMEHQSFNRIFKETTGQTPMEYREQYLSKGSLPGLGGAFIHFTEQIGLNTYQSFDNKNAPRTYCVDRN